MRVKKYRARDTNEAYRAIKADLGEEAVILQVQKAREGGLRGLFRPHLVEVLAASDESRAVGVKAATATVSDPRLESLHTDIGDLRRQVATLSGRLAAGVMLPGVLQRPFEQLVDLGVDATLAQRLLSEVQDELNPRAMENASAVWQALQRHAAELVRVRPPLGPSRSTTRVVFLVGPTGVGKTTTIAKLAAGLCLPQRRSLALISMDTFRVGAVAQLQTFADILGLPLHVAYDAQELAALVAQNSDKEYVLVDTPGRSQHNAEHLDELRLFLEVVDQREVLLTMALSTALSEALEIVRRFEVVPIHGLIVTKLDEVRTHGSLLSLVDRVARPIAYLTTGQHVPQDIECATPMGLAAWSLGRNHAG